MIQVTKAVYDLAPYGAGYGQPCLAFYFEDNPNIERTANSEITPIGKYNENQPMGYVSVEEIEKHLIDMHLTKEEYLAGEALYKSLVSLVESEKLDVYFEKFMMGERAKNTHFVGDVISSPEYRHIFSTMLMVLSYNSRVKQVDFYEHDKSKIMKQLSAPRLAYVGLPKYYSGAEQFYENFNTIHAVIKPDTDFEVINPLSLVEFSNHQFSTANFILTDNYEEEFEAYKAKFIDELDFCAPHKRYFIDASEHSHKEIAELIKKEDYRLQIIAKTSMEF